jgi:hypothetical protein
MPPRSTRASSRGTTYATRSRTAERGTDPSPPGRISRGHTSRLYGTDELPPAGTGLADYNTTLAFAEELALEVERAERLADQVTLQSSSQPPTSPLANRHSTQPRVQSRSQQQPQSRESSDGPSSQLRSEDAQSEPRSSPPEHRSRSGSPQSDGSRSDSPQENRSRSGSPPQKRSPSVSSSKYSDLDMDDTAPLSAARSILQRRSAPPRLSGLGQSPSTGDLPSGGKRLSHRLFEQRYEGGLEIPHRRRLGGIPRFLQTAAIELMWAFLYALPILLTIYLTVNFGPFVARMMSPRPLSLEDVFPITPTNRTEIPPVSVLPSIPKIPSNVPEMQMEPSRPQNPPHQHQDPTPPPPVTTTITTTIHRAAGRDKVLSELQKDIRGIESQIRSVSELVREFDAWRSARLRPNFFSPVLGAVVDPAYTSPTNPRGVGAVSRLYQTLRYRLFRNPSALPPARALAPWIENGDCWCAAAAPRGRLSIGVRLGRPVVPRALIVDHVPKAAALDIRTAPRRLDVWGRIAPGFDVDGLPDAWRDNAKGCESPSPGRGDAAWVCLGKMAYNIDDEAHHAQELSLVGYYGAAPFRIDRAVVRVLDNHGAAYSCLYQIKLEGWAGVDSDEPEG